VRGLNRVVLGDPSFMKYVKKPIFIVYSFQYTKDMILPDWFARYQQAGALQFQEIVLFGSPKLIIRMKDKREMIANQNDHVCVTPATEILVVDYTQLHLEWDTTDTIRQDEWWLPEVYKDLVQAVKFLKQAKDEFCPNTTNSDVDTFLKKHARLLNPVKQLDMGDQYPERL
jgi:hypothetical protein